MTAGHFTLSPGSPLGVQVHNLHVSEAREIIHALISDARTYLGCAEGTVTALSISRAEDIPVLQPEQEAKR
jgi:hypothetical protein